MKTLGKKGDGAARACVHVDVVAQAVAAARAGIDMALAELGENLAGISGSSDRMPVQAAIPFGRQESLDDLLSDARRAVEHGAASIYCASSAENIAQIAKEDVAVFAHAGLVPQVCTGAGGLKAVGKTADQAARIYDQIRRFEDAGAAGVYIHLVPDRVAALISSKTPLITVSAGAGPGCDMQLLYSADMLGQNLDHVPRHSKVYAETAVDGAPDIPSLEPIYRAFKEETANGRFPAPCHIATISDREFEAFAKLIDG